VASITPALALKENAMSSHLTAGQKALIESALRLRQSELDRRLATQQGGQSRAEHARDVLLQDRDDATQRDVDREVDLALNDLESVELGRVSRALARIHDADFGLCHDCGTQIPFDRLKLEPYALRCVRCESAHERAEGGAPRSAA
jgi:RNA polymerase-binding transcription factor